MKHGMIALAENNAMLELVFVPSYAKFQTKISKDGLSGGNLGNAIK